LHHISVLTFFQVKCDGYPIEPVLLILILKFHSPLSLLKEQSGHVIYDLSHQYNQVFAYHVWMISYAGANCFLYSGSPNFFLRDGSPNS
jgi:hypothetical protein